MLTMWKNCPVDIMVNDAQLINNSQHQGVLNKPHVDARQSEEESDENHHLA